MCDDTSEVIDNEDLEDLFLEPYEVQKNKRAQEIARRKQRLSKTKQRHDLFDEPE